MITQAIEDQCGQLAGRGDDSDVAAAPGRDPVAGLAEAGVAG